MVNCLAALQLPCSGCRAVVFYTKASAGLRLELKGTDTPAQIRRSFVRSSVFRFFFGATAQCFLIAAGPRQLHELFVGSLFFVENFFNQIGSLFVSQQPRPFVQAIRPDSTSTARFST